MPKGKPLAPGVAELVGELYAKTGNLSETARSLNLPFETVRDLVARTSNANRRQLHERAIDEGLERGREHLAEAVEQVGRQFVDALITDNPEAALSAAERRDLMNALAGGTRGLVNLKLLRLKNLQSRLTRERTRAEIERLRGDDNGGLSAEERAELRALLGRRPEAPDGNDRRGADPPVAGDAGGAVDPDPAVGPAEGGG